MNDIHSVVYGILGGLVAVVTTSIGVANWLHSRFNTLDAKINIVAQQLAVEVERLRADLGSTGNREMSHWDMAEYRLNGLKELIEHRTNRFTVELQRVETTLLGEVNEVKGFLEKTTEFRIRSTDR